MAAWEVITEAGGCTDHPTTKTTHACGSRSAAGVAPELVGQSEELRVAIELARKVAGADINVLLVGETGTGKDVFARTIHAASKRAAGPFVPVDCSTLTEKNFAAELFGYDRNTVRGVVGNRSGLLASAQGGTLFLGDVEHLDQVLQAKLQRVLQDRSFLQLGGRQPVELDVRIIAATNVDLQLAVREKRFREDLYYDLDEVALCLPALRERPGDIALLARHFANVYAERFHKLGPIISPEVLSILERHSWPGNVRELESVMKSAVVLAEGTIEPGHLPAGLVRAVSEASRRAEASAAAAGSSGATYLKIDVDYSASEIDLRTVFCAAESALIRALVERRRMRPAQLAKVLNVDPKTLRGKLRKYGFSET